MASNRLATAKPRLPSPHQDYDAIWARQLIRDLEFIIDALGQRLDDLENPSVTLVMPTGSLTLTTTAATINIA